MSRAHHVLSAAGPFDAVTAHAKAWRDVLAERGIDGAVFANWIDPRTDGVTPLDRLSPAGDDALVLHYSAYAPRLRPLLALPQRKLLVHHNVTPPRFLWNHHTRVAMQCSLGRQQLPEFARAADAAAADSSYNARELEDAGARDVQVVPILVPFDRYAARGTPPEGEGPLVLCVGRFVPNKRHDLVVQAFAAWQRAHAPDARLLCVGEPLTREYVRFLQDVAAAEGARNVRFVSGLAQPDLNSAYAAADVLLSLSEHEGFCVPLLEAFHFGLPVVARPAGGAIEVGGDAVLWTDADAPDLAVVAELIELAVRDQELRRELVARGRAQVELFSHERTADKAFAAVERVLAAPAPVA